MIRHPHRARHRSQPHIPARSAPRTSQPSRHRLHDRLVRVGVFLILAAVALIAAHLLIDTTPPDEQSLWIYTLGSYETAFILTIGGLALVLRESPGSDHDSR